MMSTKELFKKDKSDNLQFQLSQMILTGLHLLMVCFLVNGIFCIQFRNCVHDIYSEG